MSCCSYANCMVDSNLVHKIFGLMIYKPGPLSKTIWSGVPCIGKVSFIFLITVSLWSRINKIGYIKIKILSSMVDQGLCGHFTHEVELLKMILAYIYNYYSYDLEFLCLNLSLYSFWLEFHFNHTWLSFFKLLK